MSNEWFERGVADAQNDQLNTTYYQHYYYYRLGYDQARRQMRRPAIRSGRPWAPRRSLLLAALVLAVLGAWYLLLRETTAEPVATAPTAQPRPTMTARPTAVPTALPAPSPAPLALRPEGFAQIVNTNGAPLNARAEPALGSPVQAKLAEGSRVRLLEGPIEADNYIWWRVEGEAGAGWCAQGEPGGAQWLEPVP
jgi:hypothetical protein